MKRYIWVLLILVPGLSSGNTPPQVTNVMAFQRPHVAVVDIFYDIFDADGDDVHVTLWYSLDDGNSWDHECVTVSGDVGPGIVPATGLSATWDAGTDVPDFVHHQFSVRVYADDGSGGVPEGFVMLSGGIFLMGSPDFEEDRYVGETLHQVTLTHDFFIQAKEVTNQQYADLAQWAYDNGYCTATSVGLNDALDGSTQEIFELDYNDEIVFSDGSFTVMAGKENHPVQKMLWYGAVAYCDWLSMQQGLPRAYDHVTWLCNNHDPYGAQGYRLPTEAEWEYACRGGTQTPFNTGNCLDAETEANYNGAYPYSSCAAGPYLGGTVPVGSYPANAFGLFDMHGNLIEWCNDLYGEYSGNAIDPVGPNEGPIDLYSYMVVRDGSWDGFAGHCRSARRGNFIPDYPFSSATGFRPVRSAN